jgi:hypothetical protein
MFIMLLMDMAYLRPARRAGVMGRICRARAAGAGSRIAKSLIRQDFIFAADSLAMLWPQEPRQLAHRDADNRRLGRPCLSALGKNRRSGRPPHGRIR